MDRTHAQMQRDEIDAHKRGEFKYEPEPDRIMGDNSVEFQKGLDELRELNASAMKKTGTKICGAQSIPIKRQKQMAIHVSTKVYARIATKAKREKLSIEKYLEKVIAEK